jgi:hypothetical protein
MTRALTAIVLSTAGVALIALALPAVYTMTRTATDEPVSAPSDSAVKTSAAAQATKAEAEQAGVRVILASPYSQDGVINASKLTRGRSEPSRPGAVEPARDVAKEPPRPSEPPRQVAEPSRQAPAAGPASPAEQLAMQQPAEPQRLSAADAPSVEQKTATEGKSVEPAKVAGVSKEAPKEALKQDDVPSQVVDVDVTGAIELQQSQAKRADAGKLRARDRSARHAAAAERRRIRQMARQGEEPAREPQVGDLVDAHLLRDAPAASRRDTQRRDTSQREMAADRDGGRRTTAREPKVGDLVDARLLENAPMVSAGGLTQ